LTSGRPVPHHPREALARDFDNGAASAFSFDGVLCDRIVAGVLARR
jgi:RNA polymerase sigma-70 factor (ECF subfamily)